MKHLKIYENYQTEEEVAKICKEYGIRNWSINSDGLVDVDGDVELSSKSLNKLPLKFGKVGGNFWCDNNQLTTLEGSPETVGDDFWCGNNQLTTLEGSPETVGDDFWCQYNKLTTLEGAPKTVGGYFGCYNNKLITLEGGPKTVGGNFYCYNNRLTTLKGSPETVDGDFDCSHNQLTTLEGAPYSVGSFDCEWNDRLDTLITKNLKHIKHILANQDIYKIYNPDGSINKYRFDLMMKSID